MGYVSFSVETEGHVHGPSLNFDLFD